MMGATDGVWIFAYGSLMWDPGFPRVESLPAQIHGWHRALCIQSWHYRGTRERPGLVLGLEPGGSCRGLAYRVAPTEVAGVLAYLDEREMMAGVYSRHRLTVTLPSGPVPAHVYVARPDHEQYAGRLAPKQAAELVRKASGVAGSNLDYVRNTVERLEAMGVRDRLLRRVMTLAQGSA